MQLKSLSYGNYPLNLLGRERTGDAGDPHEAAGESILAGTSRALHRATAMITGSGAPFQGRGHTLAAIGDADPRPGSH
jgi:hypothetical protein